MEIEQTVSYDEWVPGGFGTADVIIAKGDTLYVIDLKYGKGVKVEAEGNPQGMLYALGALEERSFFQSFEKVVIVIHQPRLDYVSTWEITPDELYEWAEWAKGRAQLCAEPNAVRVPGEKQCRWCRAQPLCPALLHYAEEAMTKSFEVFDETEILPTVLTDDQLRLIMKRKDVIKKFLQSVEEYVKGKVLAEGFDGWKVVNGRSSQKWIDEPKAERLLRRLLGAADAYKKTLLTPPAAKKALGKEKKHRIEKLIYKSEGAPALVPEKDKRPAIKKVTIEDFDAFK